MGSKQGSSIYTVRLHPDDPREKRALEILQEELVRHANDRSALRYVITEALLALRREKAEPPPRQIEDLKDTEKVLQEARQLLGELKRLAVSGGGGVVRQAVEESALDDDLLDSLTGIISTKEF